MKRISLTGIVFAGVLLHLIAFPQQSRQIPRAFPQKTEAIFPGLKGRSLWDSLVATYKPVQVLDYDAARDTLFRRIDAHNDSITGIYSGYTIYLDPTKDPSAAAWENHMDTEHCWPQSKGAAEGNAHNDMHHLYPARDVVNSARSNLPFAEIPDEETDYWYRKDEIRQTEPISHKDEYSEKDVDAQLFEPRESVKGNIARSMFYFYTMYHSQADHEDPTFFRAQLPTLYQWHKIDPPDAQEINRTLRIAHYQENKPNPFVLDTSLVRRLFFPGINRDPPYHLHIIQRTTHSITLQWLPPFGYEPNRNDFVILARADFPVNADPTGQTVNNYQASPIFGQGSQVDSGNYVVMIGDSTQVTVTGLSTQRTYYFTIWNTLDKNQWSEETESIAASTAETHFSVMISEFMANPSTVPDNQGEWLELTNYGTQPVDINGWILRDADYDYHKIQAPSPLIIYPDSFLVLGINADKSTNGGVPVDYQYHHFYLANSSDEIVLVASDGKTVVDSIAYTPTAGWQIPEGASLVFWQKPGQKHQDPDCWTVSSIPWNLSNPDRGSPGFAGPEQYSSLHLIQFQGKVLDSAVTLQWVFQPAPNSMGFRLYRRPKNFSESTIIASFENNPALQIPHGTADTLAMFFKDSSVKKNIVYYYWLEDVNQMGVSTLHDTIEIPFLSTGFANQNASDTLAPSLHWQHAFPNPSNSNVMVNIYIPPYSPSSIHLKIHIYNLQGKLITTLFYNNLSPGWHQFIWDGKNQYQQSVPSGIYFMHCRSGNTNLWQKIVILR